MIRRLWLAGLGAVVFAVALPSARARAPHRPGRVLVANDAASCTVRAIRALAHKGGIDKRLRFLRRQLSRAPFSAFRSFKLLSAKKLAIPHGASRKTTLPGGRLLKLTFKDKLLLKRKVRLRMHLRVHKTARAKKLLQNTLYTVVNGRTFLNVYAAEKGKALVVGITCSAK